MEFPLCRYTFSIVKSVTTFGAICMHFDGSWVVFEHPVCIWDCPSINLTHGCHGHALVGRSKLARGCIGLHPWSVLESARSVPEFAKSLVPAPVFACSSPEGPKWNIRLQNQAVHIIGACHRVICKPQFHPIFICCANPKCIQFCMAKCSEECCRSQILPTWRPYIYMTVLPEH